MEEKKQKWVIRRYLAGMPTRLIAAHLQISIRTAYRVIEKYKKFGEISVSRKVGRPRGNINRNVN